MAGLGLAIPTFCGRLLGWPGAERPSVPRPEPGWGHPLISLLLVTLQWGRLLGFYPVRALYGLLLIGGPRASHKPPSIEEGRWAPSSGPLPRVLCPLALAARFGPARGSLCHHGWGGSWARPGNESSESASIWGIAAALYWHPPRPSYISSFCTLGREGGREEAIRTCPTTNSQAGQITGALFFWPKSFILWLLKITPPLPPPRGQQQEFVPIQGETSCG